MTIISQKGNIQLIIYVRTYYLCIFYFSTKSQYIPRWHYFYAVDLSGCCSLVGKSVSRAENILEDDLSGKGGVEGNIYLGL